MRPVTTQAEEHQNWNHHDPTADTHRPAEDPSAQADEDEFPGLAGEGVVHLLSLGVLPLDAGFVPTRGPACDWLGGFAWGKHI